MSSAATWLSMGTAFARSVEWFVAVGIVAVRLFNAIYIDERDLTCIA